MRCSCEWRMACCNTARWAVVQCIRVCSLHGKQALCRGCHHNNRCRSCFSFEDLSNPLRAPPISHAAHFVSRSGANDACRPLLKAEFARCSLPLRRAPLYFYRGSQRAEGGRASADAGEQAERDAARGCRLTQRRGISNDDDTHALAHARGDRARASNEQSTQGSTDKVRSRAPCRGGAPLDDASVSPEKRPPVALRRAVFGALLRQTWAHTKVPALVAQSSVFTTWTFVTQVQKMPRPLQITPI